MKGHLKSGASQWNAVVPQTICQSTLSESETPRGQIVIYLRKLIQRFKDMASESINSEICAEQASTIRPYVT